MAARHCDRICGGHCGGGLRGAYHWNKPEEWLAMRRQIKQLVSESEEPVEFIERKKKLKQSITELQDTETSDKANDPDPAAGPSSESSVPDAS